MKKAGIFAAVIAAVLIFLQMYSYKLAGYTPEAVYTVPDAMLASALLKDENDATEILKSLELHKLDASSPYYKRGKDLFLGAEKTKADTGYPMYKEDGAGVYTLSGSMGLINTEFDVLPSYEWLYLSGGTSFNQDGSQADPDEFILMSLSGGLYLNSQEAIITGRAGNPLASIKENSIARYNSEKLSWYEFQGGKLVYGECTQLFDANITIGSVTMDYAGFLEKLGLLKEFQNGGKNKPSLPETTVETSPEEPVETVSENGVETAEQSEEEAYLKSDTETVTTGSEQETAGESVTGTEEETSGKETSSREVSVQDTNPFFSDKGNSAPKNDEKNKENGGGSPGKGEAGGDNRPPQEGDTPTGPTYDDPWGVPGEGGSGEGEGDGDGGADHFYMPKVTVGSFTMGVYTASTTLTIEDDNARIIKGVRLIIYRDDRVYMRKLIKTSGPVTMDPLPPDTHFEIEGYFDYYGRNESKETFYYLKKQKLPEPTRKIEELNKLEFSYEDQVSTKYVDRLLVKDMKLAEEIRQPQATAGNADSSYVAVLPYVQRLDIEIQEKVFIGGITSVQSIDTTLLNRLKAGQVAQWITLPVLDSNSSYEYEFRFYDRFGNNLRTSPALLTGMGRTSKKLPKAQIQFGKNAPVGEQPVTITMNNKDDAQFYRQNETGGYDGVKTATFYMVDVNDMANPIELDVTGTGDKVRYVDVSSVDGKQSAITVYNLPAGHVYYGIVTGSFDLDDGSFYTDKEIGRSAFSTSSLASLGSVNFIVKSSNVTSTSADVQAYLRTGISRQLLPFIKRTEVILTNMETGEIYRTISLKKEELNQHLMTETEYEVEDKTGESPFGERTVISLASADGSVTAWDALLSTGTVKIYFPDKSMKSNTQYQVSLRTYASQDVEGAVEEDVTGRYYTGNFKTMKLRPEVTYQNMLVTNSFAQIYGLKINDPDGVIKNGAVTAVLTMADNGKTVSLQASTVDKVNGMESYSFKSLSNRVRYQLKFYGIEYNEGFTLSTVQTNVPLHTDPEILFETGMTIDGSTDVSGLTDIYGGVIKGVNLFDPNDAKLNTDIVDGTGAEKYTYGDSVASDFIPVDDTKTYLYTGNTRTGIIYYYDSDKNFLGSTPSQLNNYWRIDEPLPGAAFVRLRLYPFEMNAISYCELGEAAFRGDSPTNLFNAKTAEEGRVLSGTGTAVVSVGTFVSDYIKITGGNRYVKMHGRYNTNNANRRRIEYYDEDKKFISYKDFSRWYGTCQAPDNARYVRISAETICLEDLYFGEVPEEMFSSNLLDRDAVTSGYYRNYYGSEIEYAERWYSEYIPAEAGATYTKLGTPLNIVFYDKDKAYIGGWDSTSYSNVSFIVPEGTAFIIMNGNLSNLDQAKLFKTMPSAGSNDMTARISVNLTDKQNYLKDHPYYWIDMEIKDSDGTYRQIESRKCDLAVVDGEVQPVSEYQEFRAERSSTYRVSMKVDLFDQKKVVLDEAEFSTAEPAAKNYIIRTEAGLAAMRSNPYGTYLAVNDIVNDTRNAFAENFTFQGTLDFQGNNLTRVGCSQIMRVVGEWGLVENMVLHVDSLKNQSSYSEFAHLAHTNYGTIRNIVADFKINVAGSKGAIGGLCNVNATTGIIENFSLTLLDNMYAGGAVGLAAVTNRGIIRNGYAYDNGQGYKIDTSIGNTGTSASRGVITGYNEGMGLVENVFSLVDIDLTSPESTVNTIGAVVGYSIGTARNMFTTGDAMFMGVPLLSYGPAVGGVDGFTSSPLSNIQYVRLKEHQVECYKNTYNKEADKKSLLDPSWYEKAINGDQAFDTSVVTSGFYPRLKMSEALNNAQPMMPLPAVVKPSIPVMTSAVVKEQREKDADVEFVFQNPQKVPIRGLTVSAKDKAGTYQKAMDVRIVDQYEGEDGNYHVNAVAYNPVEFYSIYHVNRFDIQNGSSPTDIISVENQVLPVYLSFYDEITDLQGWKKIVSGPDENYRICSDLDFGSVPEDQMKSYIISTFSGKLEGSYETPEGQKIATLKNIKLIGPMFATVSGSIKNLRIDGLESNGASVSASAGFIGIISKGTADNVQIKNGVVKAGYRGGVLANAASFGNVINCGVIDSVLESRRSSSQINFGGLVGYASHSKFENCFVTGVTMDIRSALFVQGAGGVVGVVEGHTAIYNCYAQGQLLTNYSNSGGIVGSVISNKGLRYCISKMDIITNGSGYTGGIIGNLTVGASEMVAGNLSVGDLYSSAQNPVFFHRILGINSNKSRYDNLAYSGQVFRGGIDENNLDDADGMVTSQQLKLMETYMDRLKLDTSAYEFAYVKDGVPMGIAQGYLPLIKDSKTGEVLENQVPCRISQTGAVLKVESMVTNASPQKEFEELFGTGAVPDFGTGKLYKLNFYVEAEQPYAILEAAMEGISMNATHSYGGVLKETFKENAYMTADQKSRTARQYPFLSSIYSFDRYRLTVKTTPKANLMADGSVIDEGQVSVVSASFDLAEQDRSTYKIGNAREWNDIMSVYGDTYGNFELTGDIDGSSLPAGESLVTGVKVNRLYSTKEGGVTIRNISIKSSNYAESVIQEATSGIRFVNFENITIDSSAIASGNMYVGVVGLLWGPMEHAAFRQITIKANGNYMGCVGFGGGNISDVELTDIKILGKGSHHGGLAGSLNSGDEIKALGAKNGDAFTYEISGEGRIGGIAGTATGVLSNVQAEGLRVKASGAEAGGILGYGNFNINHAQEPDQNSRAVSCVVTAASRAGGLIGTGTAQYAEVESCSVMTSGSSAGGIMGYFYSSSILTKNVTVKNTIITGDLYVGGIYGTMEWTTMDYSKVENCVITGRSYVGGFGGTGGGRYAEISNTYIKASSSYAGGLVGNQTSQINRSEVYNCRIVANSYVGGAVGALMTSAQSNSRITVSNTSIECGRMTAEGNWASYAGGFCGYMPTAGSNFGYTIDDSTTIDGEGNYVGGLAGYMAGGNYFECAVGAQINQKEGSGDFSRYVGGIAGGLNTYGELATATAKITSVYNCYFTGNVAGADYVGGLFGALETANEPEAPLEIIPEKFYGLVMAGNVTATTSERRPSVHYLANRMDGGQNIGTAGYFRVRDESLIGGTPVAALGLEYLDQAADGTGMYMVTGRQLADKAMYINPYENKGLNWPRASRWSEQGLLPLYGYQLKITPEPVGTKVNLYDGSVPDGTYDAVVEVGYAGADLCQEYDGIQNTRNGHDPNARVWENLAGDEAYDLKPIDLNFDLIVNGSAVTGHDGWTDNAYRNTTNNTAPAKSERGWATNGTDNGFLRDFTVTATFRTDSAGPGSLAGMGTWGSGAKNGLMAIESQKVKMFAGNSMAQPDTYAKNVIHSAAATFTTSDKKTRLYVDGILKQVITSGSDWTAQFYGSGFQTFMASNGYTYKGELFNAKLYTRAISPEEVLQNHKTDLLRFDQGAGGIVKRRIPVDFQNGSAQLDLAGQGLPVNTAIDVKVWIQPTQSLPPEPDTSAVSITNGTLHSLRYGQNYIEYKAVTDEHGTSVLKKNGMYTTGKNPVASINPAGNIQWYRSTSPGYCGTAIAGATGAEETLAGRGYYYAEVTVGGAVSRTPLILVEDGVYMPYMKDYGTAGYPVVNGQEGYKAVDREEALVLPDRYDLNDNHTKTEVPEFMNKVLTAYDVGDNWYSGGISVPGASMIILGNSGVSTTALLVGAADLPSLEVYPSGADTVNLEFGIDSVVTKPEAPGNSQQTAFSIYAGDVLIGSSNVEERVYTFKYDYESPLKIVIASGSGKSDVREYSANDLKRTVMTWEDGYYYLKEGKICSNKPVPQGTCVNLYGGRALMEDGTIEELAAKTASCSSLGEMKLLEVPVPLYTSEYDGRMIKSYERHSEIIEQSETGVDRTVRELKLAVKNGRLFALDTTETVSGSLIADSYLDQVYSGILDESGNWENLGDEMKVPAGISLKGIAHTSENLGSHEPWLLIRYENGMAKGFNYVTGEMLEISNPESAKSMIRYAQGYLSSKWESWFAQRKESFAELKELEEDLTVYPLDDTMLIQGDRAQMAEKGQSETEFAAEGDGALTDGNSSADGTADISGVSSDSGSSGEGGIYVEDSGLTDHEREPKATGPDGEFAANSDMNADGNSNSANKTESQNSASSQISRIKTEPGSKGKGSENNSGINSSQSDSSDTAPIKSEDVNSEEKGIQPKTDLSPINGQIKPAPQSGSTVKTNYVYVYRKDKGSYDLYKAEDMLQKDERDLLSEVEKMEQLKEKGILANVNQVEKTRLQSGSKEDAKGLAVFAATAVTALILAGYVVRKKKTL